ncbi:hypothetical protein QYE76_064348 [Lolium multiflorum]|uniref:Uncharacterized protein n=1 Tax=Lolium multiflorum TaxID=4521 RepID=A0AAD8S857_LOLMU|nr:hypothetical protein QYE76_064348 [Lolium multiflorum]
MAASLHPACERRRWIHEEPLSVVLASSSLVTAIAHVLVCRRWHAAKSSSRLHLALDARLLLLAVTPGIRARVVVLAAT